MGRQGGLQPRAGRPPLGAADRRAPGPRLRPSGGGESGRAAPVTQGLRGGRGCERGGRRGRGSGAERAGRAAPACALSRRPRSFCPAAVSTGGVAALLCEWSRREWETSERGAGEVPGARRVPACRPLASAAAGCGWCWEGVPPASLHGVPPALEREGLCGMGVGPGALPARIPQSSLVALAPPMPLLQTRGCALLCLFPLRPLAAPASPISVCTRLCLITKPSGCEKVPTVPLLHLAPYTAWPASFPAAPHTTCSPKHPAVPVSPQPSGYAPHMLTSSSCLEEPFTSRMRRGDGLHLAQKAATRFSFLKNAFPPSSHQREAWSQASINEMEASFSAGAKVGSSQHMAHVLKMMILKCRAGV